MQGEQEKHKFRVYLAELLPGPQPFAITDLSVFGNPWEVRFWRLRVC